MVRWQRDAPTVHQIGLTPQQHRAVPFQRALFQREALRGRIRSESRAWVETREGGAVRTSISSQTRLRKGSTFSLTSHASPASGRSMLAGCTYPFSSSASSSSSSPGPPLSVRRYCARGSAAHR